MTSAEARAVSRLHPCFTHWCSDVRRPRPICNGSSASACRRFTQTLVSLEKAGLIGLYRASGLARSACQNHYAVAPSGETQITIEPPINRGTQPISRKKVIIMQMVLSRIAVLSAIFGLVACSQQTPGQYTNLEGKPPDATVTMNEVQAAYIGNAGGGSGTLQYRGTA